MQKTVICKDISGKEYTVDVSQLTFRPSVYAVISHQGQVLVSQQWDGHDFPGGGITLGETIEEAVIREVKEETGLTIQPKQILESTSSFFKMPFDDIFVESISLYYLCEVLSGEISTAFFDEHEKEYLQQAIWLPIEEAKTAKFYSAINVPLLLEKALAFSK